MNRIEFGQFIADTRRSRGMTQKDLADKLHVTNTAVSKWERGLSYPDIALLDELAAILQMSTAELIACRREPDTVNVDAILDIAKESSRHLRKRFCVVLSLLCIAAALILGVVYIHFFRYLKNDEHTVFWGKQTTADGSYLFIEKDNRLLTLSCSDPQLYDSIIANDSEIYDVSYRFNPLSYRGKLLQCTPAPDDVLGSPEDTIGSSIGVDTLFNIDYMLQESTNVYSDPARENAYLCTYRYYYCGDGKDYYLGEELPQTTVLIIKNCRAAVGNDYDNDGIVELFVLTRYDEAPYMLYDIQDGSIICSLIENVPSDVQDTFQRCIIK